MANPSLENQPSVSALNVARCRAVAANEPREEIRGRDTLAELFLGEEAQKSLKDPVMHAMILKKLSAVSPGGYEYFIARTAYLDTVVEQALQDNIPQIIFLGAGYDTRAYRFSDLIHASRIFELDIRSTQEHKRFLLDQAQIAIPPQLTFLPIDFTKDNMVEVLLQGGYDPHQWTLFIWEGVCYYLPPQTVDETLSLVRENSPAGSVICFDYMIAGTTRFGAEQARAAMRAMYTAEPLLFELEQNNLASFLAERGLQIAEHLSPEDLQKKYLTLRDGSAAGEILGLFGLVKAVVC